MRAKEIEKTKKMISKLYRDKVDTTVRTKDKESFRRFYENLVHLQNVQNMAAQDFICAANLLTRLLKSDDSSPREIALLTVFLYLLCAEGQICNILNWVSYLLVATGHDLFTLAKRKYVEENMEAVMRVEMWTKIQFLKHHGFGALTREYDSTFRNDIAHHNFAIDDEGIIWVRGNKIDLQSKMESLSPIIEAANESLVEVIKELKKAYKEMEETISRMRKDTAKT